MPLRLNFFCNTRGSPRLVAIMTCMEGGAWAHGEAWAQHGRGVLQNIACGQLFFPFTMRRIAQPTEQDSTLHLKPVTAQQQPLSVAFWELLEAPLTHTISMTPLLLRSGVVSRSAPPVTPSKSHTRKPLLHHLSPNIAAPCVTPRTPLNILN